MQRSAHRFLTNQPTNLEGIRSSRTCHQILEVLTGRLGGWLLGFVSFRFNQPILEKTAASLKFWRIFQFESSSPKFDLGATFKKNICVLKPPPSKSLSKWMANVTQDVRFRSLIHLKISNHFWKVVFCQTLELMIPLWYPKHPQESKLQCWMSNGRNRFQSSHLPPMWEPLSIIVVIGKEFAMGFHDFNELASGIPITCVSSQGTVWGFCLCHSASCELRDLGDVCATHPAGMVGSKHILFLFTTRMFKVQVSIQFPVSWAKSISNSQTAVLFLMVWCFKHVAWGVVKFLFPNIIPTKMFPAHPTAS